MSRESYEVTVRIAVTAAVDQHHATELDRSRWVKEGAEIACEWIDRKVGGAYRDAGGGFEILSSTAIPTTVQVA